MSPRRYYFRAPRFDISSDSPTAPRLGSIFSNLKRLTAPLNQGSVPWIPTDLTNTTNTPNFQDTVSRNLQGSAGLATSLNPALSTADLIYTFATSSRDTYRCAALETVEFEPDAQFVCDCITASLRVQDALRDDGLWSLRGARVYMITGLKIATGFCRSSTSDAEHGPQLRVELDGTGLGVPVTAGPEVEVSFGASREVSHGPAVGKIVFAYRAVEIRAKRDGRVRYKDLSGGQYGLGLDEEDEEHVSWDVEPVGEEVMREEFPEEEMVAVRAGLRGGQMHLTSAS